MKSCISRRQIVVSAFLFTGLFVPVGRQASTGAAGFRDGYVVRVEEDWKLIVSQPNAQTASPQVSTQMTRNPSSTRFCNVHLNSRDVPTYCQGGLQVQAWRSANSLGSADSPSNAVMSTQNEVVTWTQYLRQDGTDLKFGISAASSQTWGDFSGLEIVVPTRNTTLDYYTVDYSTQNSGVTFGANRVTYFGIQGVRIYYSDGTIQTDSTERVIYPAQNNATGG